MNEEQSIEVTRDGFETSFCNHQTLYNKQTQDSNHLTLMIDKMNIQAGNRILDLGTGTGYVAFEIANRYENIEIVGLDIVDKTLKKNRKKAIEENLHNISFESYDGRLFPFNDNVFDIVVCRYALHHFPNIKSTFSELSRVLKNKGRLFISDPTPNDNDSSRFVDDYMRIKPDGHIKYYTKSEYESFGEKAGFVVSSAFLTDITFPRINSGFVYQEIIDKHDNDIVSGYHICYSKDEKFIYITQNVWNISMINCKEK